jgi:drug/metabolite transporter (DMT)-like permease
MEKASHSSLLDSLPAPVLVLVSRGLQSLGTPLIALLISTADGLGGRVDEAISFCNVLFVGNLCAAAVVTARYGPRRIGAELRAVPGRARVELLGFGMLSALLSGLIFSSLETTSVTNAVLLARLGPVVFAVVATLLAGGAIRGAEWAGFGLIGVGALATVVTRGGFQLATGDELILASAVVYALVTLSSKRLIPTTGLPALVFARNFLSAWIFFAIANVVYGPHHFADAFYGPLWGIMLVYAAVVIVLAQLAWYRSLERLSPAAVARWTVLMPVLAVGYAFLINGERPGPPQLAGLAFVTAGIVVSNLGRRTPRGMSPAPETSVAAS